MYVTKLPPIEGDDYKVHQTIRSLFERDQRMLFQRSPLCVTVLSERKPNQACGKVKLIDFDKMIEGEQYLFSLRLNPASRSLKTGKRVPIASDKIPELIQKKFEDAGAKPQFQIVNEGIRYSYKNGHTISLISIRVVGFLTVFRADAFRKAIAFGIGHAKGLGFGLLNIFS